ncbi:MAG: hypothetical protein C9356_12495 [Oleiphilus sp.]|nr:MAG: hypothetical protein C9356_12495 [Oleiphilus sp.]
MSIENVLHIDLQDIGRVSVDSASFVPSGRAHSLESGEEGDVGFGSTHRAAKLDFSIFKVAGLSVQQINDFSGSITIQTDEGSTYLMTDARLVGDVTLSNGRMGGTFHSLNSREVG